MIKVIMNSRPRYVLLIGYEFILIEIPVVEARAEFSTLLRIHRYHTMYIVLINPVLVADLTFYTAFLKIQERTR